MPPSHSDAPALAPDRLEEILARVRDLDVVVVGDLMLDVYLRGAASRISPEAPVPVVHVAEEWRALGGAANVAANITALGARCHVVGCIGDDAQGALVRQEVVAAGITDRGIELAADRPTTVKTRIIAGHHQVARYDRERDTDVDAACINGLVERIHDLGADADAIILEDYNKGVLVPEVIAAAREVAEERGIPLIVDPKARRFFDYAGATVFKPNRVELADALREPVAAHDAEWMEATRTRLECRHLLVTLGADGMALATADGALVRIPSMARSVYDVSGAGDTVTASLAAGLAAGASVVEAAVLANHAAGIEVGKAGVATVTPEELRETIRRKRGG